MSDVFSIFMPGHAHWEEVKRAEKMLLVDAKQGGNGPDPLDLDEGYMVLRDRTGSATQASTDIGNPNRVRVGKQEDPAKKSAADDITTMPLAADPHD
ncbi:MAG: hypothetical protein GX454_06215 [Brooklawnia sp.]|nr:hypothetical protein [Brooklawnia sp.]